MPGLLAINKRYSGTHAKKAIEESHLPALRAGDAPKPGVLDA
jgi:hypothetical protein